MRNYETMVVLVPDLTEEEINRQIDRIKDYINEDGQVESIEEMGIRTLAYKIKNKYTEGFYVLINFKAGTDVLTNLEHYYRISDAVITSLIVKKDKR